MNHDVAWGWQNLINVCQHQSVICWSKKIKPKEGLFWTPVVYMWHSLDGQIYF